MNKPVLKNSIKILLPVILVISSVTFIITTIKNSSEHKLIVNEEQAEVSLKAEGINETLSFVVGDLRILASIKMFNKLLFDPTSAEARKQIADVFQVMGKERNVFDQIRLIDTAGMEAVRINFENGNYKIVPSDELQNKKHRPYFYNSIKLNKGEVYVSPFDLNIENGKVETPFKPVLRIATPVYNSNNEKKGIVVLNYLGNHLLDSTTIINSNMNRSRFMVLNSDSYWLKADDPSLEWGFMFDDKQEVNFQHYFTEEWQIINSDKAGQFENKNGLFTFKTIYPLENNNPEIIKTDYETEETNYSASTSSYYWKVVSFIPHSTLYKSARTHNNLAWVIFTVMAVFSWFWAYLFALSVYKREQAELEIRKNELQLRELNATKDRFFSIIAHDLRSPFNAMMGISELLREELENNRSEYTKEYIQILIQSIENTYKLLTQLLDWANLQLKKVEFTPEEIDARSSIAENFELSKINAQNKNIELVNSVPEELIIKADQNMFRTIIRNLINNSIKFTPNDGTVEVSAKKENQEHIFTVADTGVGIDAASLKKLFKIEESFSTSGTNNEHGTGLGLILCKELIEKHRGRIWAESEPGKGTKFHFTIPFSE